ncbi:MAG: hypothetical protein HY255_00585 [Betaproteobacteria bacterium]|nr:hypothetical protein [Betaproteobacteria bacterium]
MKSLCLAVLMLLSGCAAVDPQNQSSQSKLRDPVRKCIASGSDRDGCARMASQLCPSGFEVFEKDAPEDDGVVRRSYHFKCLP